MNKLLLILGGLLLGNSLLAQQELGLHFMRDTWQASYTNPALIPTTKFNIGLFGLSNNFLTENITFDQAIRDGEGGKRILDVNAVIDNLDDNSNIIREQLNIETLNLGLSFGRFTLGLGHAIRFHGYMDYPKALPQLIWEGNAQFIGQEVQFAPEVQLTAYNEFAASLALELSPMLTVGGRVKFLTGIADASSSGNDLRLLTDDDIYQLRLNGNYVVNSSGAIDYDGFDEFTFELNEDSFDEFFSSNTGWAFDLGLNAKFGRLDVAVSLLDIGSITWDENVTNYQVVTPSEFTGIDVAQDILDDSETIGSVIDSLRDQYEVLETSESYSTTLPRRLYLSVGYQFSDVWHFGGLFYNERYREQRFSSFALSANAQLLSWLRLGATYAIRNETFDNLGLNAVVKLGPVQLFATTDNIITAFNLTDSNSSHGRIGLNLAFGRRDGNRRRNDIDNISDQDAFFN
ncbi:MAG: DUF5723 family protein [Bacteroidota bacterium]